MTRESRPCAYATESNGSFPQIGTSVAFLVSAPITHSSDATGRAPGFTAAQRHDPPDTPLTAELTLRPTIRHPDLTHVFRETDRRAMHLRLARDEVGRPVEQLHIHGYVPREESQLLEKAIWAELDTETELPSSLGHIGDSARSEPLAITQLLLLYHMLDSVR